MALGQPQQVRFAGRDATFTPYLDERGAVRRYPVPLDDREMPGAVLGEVKWNGGQPRAVAMARTPVRRTVNGQTLKVPARNDGHPHRKFLQLYLMPQGVHPSSGKPMPEHVAEIPVADGPEHDDPERANQTDGQTVMNMARDAASGELVDLYITKGARFMSEADILRIWATADRNAKHAADQHTAKDPVGLINMLTDTLARNAQQPARKGRKEGEAE